MRTRNANKRSSLRAASPGSDESPEKIRRISPVGKGKERSTKSVINDRYSLRVAIAKSNEVLEIARRVSPRQKSIGEKTKLIKSDRSSLCAASPESVESPDKVKSVSPRQKARGGKPESIKNDSVSSSDKGYCGSSYEDDTDWRRRTAANSGIPSVKKREREDAPDESSDSSSDDFLVPAQSINLNSEFFKIEKKEQVSDFSAIENSIFAGLNRLSESDDSDDFQDSKSAGGERVIGKAGLQKGEDIVKNEHCLVGPVTMKVEDGSDTKPSSVRRGKKALTAKQQKSSGEGSKQGKSQEDKEMLKVKEETSIPDINKLDVSQLLALGEAPDPKPKPVGKTKRRNASKKYVDSEEGISDWEEVDTGTFERQPIEYSVPREGIAVTVQVPSIHQKKKKKRFDVAAYIKRRMKRVRQDIQVLMHKAHLLCWIAHGNYVNKILNSEILMGLSLSLVPSELCYFDKHTDLAYLQQIVQWFSKTVELQETVDNSQELIVSLGAQFQKKAAKSRGDMALMFVCMLRSLGINTRLVISLQPLPLKPPSSEISYLTSKKPLTSKGRKVKKEQQKKTHCSRKKGASNTAEVIRKRQGVLTKEDAVRCVEEAAAKKMAHAEKSKQKKSNDDPVATKSIKSELVSDSGRSLRARKSVRKYVDDGGTTDSDDEMVQQEKERAKESKIVNTKSTTYKKKKSISAENIVNVPKRGKESTVAHSSGSESDYTAAFNKNRRGKTGHRVSLSIEAPMADTKKKKHRCDLWSEVFLECEEKWVCVDVYHQQIDCVQELSSRASQPVHYVLAWQDDRTIRDVTRRYCPKFHNVTRKHRVDEEWWKESLRPFTGQRTARDDQEDEDLDRQMQDRPLPTSLAEYKNHPLYVLKKDLLKFQAIYPPEAPTLGFVRGHPVYARECVHTLHSREKWLKEAKVVRLGETPYKIVTTPKWDRVNRKIIKGVPLEIFGPWQVEEYVPPTAVDGKVPRNEYGNVELFKPSMLPGGTVHMQIPGLNSVARKLQIDCAPAITGFDFHSGSCHPVYDGFVVCEEYKYVLAEAWQAEMEEADRRYEKKRLKRIYGNWRRLIKGLFIRERLKARYDFGPVKETNRSKTKKARRFQEAKRKKTVHSDDSDWEIRQCD